MHNLFSNTFFIIIAFIFILINKETNKVSFSLTALRIKSQTFFKKKPIVSFNIVEHKDLLATEIAIDVGYCYFWSINSCTVTIKMV